MRRLTIAVICAWCVAGDAATIGWNSGAAEPSRSMPRVLNMFDLVMTHLRVVGMHNRPAVADADKLKARELVA